MTRAASLFLPFALACAGCAPATNSEPDAGGTNDSPDAGKLVMPACGNAAECALSCSEPSEDPCTSLASASTLPAPAAYWPIQTSNVQETLFKSGIAGGPDATVSDGNVAPLEDAIVGSAALFGKTLTVPGGGSEPQQIPPGSAEADLATSEAFTVLGWVRVDAFAGTRMVIANQGNGPQSNTGWWFSVTSAGKLEGITYGPQGQEKIFAAPAGPCVGKWAHVAFVVSEGHGKLFLDGALVHDETLGYVAPRYGGARFTLGKATAGGASSIFDGAMDELAVYAVGLTDAQVALAYRTGFCRQPLR